MTFSVRIASVMALAGFLFAVAPTIASAGTPLLSGYGGPGAGEQAIVGSVLLKVPRGGGGSGSSGSSNASGESSAGSTTSNAGGGVSGSASSSKARSRSAHGAGSHTARGGHSGEAARNEDTRARVKEGDVYAYPSSPSASTNSSVLGLSNGDVLLLVAMIAVLGLVGAFTLRLARLQP